MTGYRAITRARKIVFWVAAVLFVFTWPLLIAYALGIVISPNAKQPVVETGVIRIDSLPGGARLYLNGNDTGKNTPTAIERLKAGSYHVSLQKPGYHDWQAQISVDIQAVRRVSSAVLVPKLPKMHLVTVGSYTSEQLSPSSQYLLFSGAHVSDLRVFDLKAGRFLPRSVALDPYLSDPVDALSLPPWGNILLLHAVSAGKERVLVLHFGTLGVELEHVVEAPFFQKVDFAWSPTLSGAVYFVRDDSLWKMENWAATSESLLAKDVRSVGIVNNSLYYIDSRGELGEVSAFGRQHVLFKLSDSIRGSIGSGAKIEYADENLGVVITRDGNLVLLQPRGSAEFRGIRGAAIDKTRDRLLVWSDSRVGSLNLPGREKDSSGGIEWAPPPPGENRISSVEPAANMSNCFYVSNGSVYIEPVLPGVVASPQRVVTLAPGEHYEYSGATGMLVVTDRAIGQIRTTRFIVHPLLPNLE